MEKTKGGSRAAKKKDDDELLSEQTKDGEESPGKPKGMSRSKSFANSKMANSAKNLVSQAAKLLGGNAEIMIRVTHTTVGTLGEEIPRTYDVPTSVNLGAQTVLLKNTHFFSRDRSKRMAQFGYLIAIIKFLFFYISVCGIMAVPTNKGVLTATRLFVVPSAFKCVVSYIEKLGKIFQKLKELRSFVKGLGGKQFVILSSLAKLLKKAQKAECPYLPLDNFIEGFVKTSKSTLLPAGEKTWGESPSNLFLSWIYSAKAALGGEMTNEDIASLKFVVSDKFMVGGAAKRIKSLLGKNKVAPAP
jgi:hypothetical protein